MRVPLASDTVAAPLTRPVKVMHIAQMLPGGIISYLEELLPTQIAHYGRENVLALVAAKDAHMMSMLAPGNVHTFRDASRSASALFDFARRAISVVRAEQPDVIHLHSSFAGALRPLLAMLSRGPRPAIVYCAHGWAFNMRTQAWKRRAYTLAERALAPFADRTICISDFEYRSAIAHGLPPRKLALIENAIASDMPTAPDVPLLYDASRLNLLFIGRFDVQKGFDIAEAAMERLHGVPVVLHAVGACVISDGSTIPGHRTSTDNILHYGWQDRSAVYGFIEKADVLVIPSRWEGFGIVAIEAMRQGKPVIATAVDALPDVIQDGVTGLIVPPEDPEALAAAIRSIDRATLVRFGEAARRRFHERFTSERLNRDILDTYRIIRRR